MKQHITVEQFKSLNLSLEMIYEIATGENPKSYYNIIFRTKLSPGIEFSTYEKWFEKRIEKGCDQLLYKAANNFNIGYMIKVLVNKLKDKGFILLFSYEEDALKWHISIDNDFSILFDTFGEELCDALWETVKFVLKEKNNEKK